LARSGQYPPSVDPGRPVEPTLPSGWTRHKFGDLLTVVERPVKLVDDVEYQLVNAKRSRGGIVARDRLKGREILVKSQFEVRPGDFVISNRQIIHGACGVVPEKLGGAVVSGEYTVLKPDERLLTDYLAHLTHTSYFQRSCFHSSVGVDVEKMVFKLDQWMRFALPIPPIAEQQRIVRILRTIERALDATQDVIDRLQVLKTAALAELLRRGLPGRQVERAW